MPKIKTLAVRACRGIRDTTLDLEGKSLILYGENGQGKSSFVDAIELFFKGQIIHLDEAKSTSTKRHAPHIQFKEKDTKVTITHNDPEATLEWTFKGISSNPDHQLSFWESGKNVNFILRRKQILDFIVAKPAGRYEQIAKVIGVTDLDEVELNLMRRTDELAEEATSLESQQGVIEKELADQLEIEKINDADILQGLNIKLVSLGQKKLPSFDKIEDHKLEAIQGTKDPKQIEQAAKVQGALELVTGLNKNKDFLSHHSPLWDAVDELTKDIELARALAFQQILTHGHDLISEFKPENCPVCEHPINHEHLLKRLEERLGLLETARQKSKVIIQLKGQLTGEVREIIRKLNDLKLNLDKLELGLELSSISNFIDHLQTIISAVKPDPIKINILPITDYLDATPVKIWTALAEKLQIALKARLDQLMVSEKDRQALQSIELLSSVTELRKRIQELGHKREIKEITGKQIDTAYQLFVETKQEEIQAIYNDIQKDMQRFYDTLHPEEDHREIKLRIDPSKRSSTEIMMGFHDRTGDPRAFQSEAHLDSLGLCTFLAFIKNFNTDFPFVVLDDVVGTIDAQHRRRVCELLFSEFKDYQLFITTHDDLWFDELVSYQAAMKVRHLFNNIRILDWSLTDGIRMDRHKPRWEIVEERLKDRDKVSAAAHARRNLEWILLQMAITTLTKVAINPSGRYVVADLYQDFKRRIRKLVPKIFADNEIVFIQLEADGLFGNLLIHNNIKAENTSIEEVRAFAKAVKALHDLVTCESGQFLQYHQTARVMKCRCGHISWNTK